MTLDFELPAADVARLLRAPAILARGRGRVRTVPVRIVWHDGPKGELAEHGLAVSETAAPGRGPRWRLERLRPNGGPDCGMDWPPAGLAPLLAEADAPDGLGQPLPARLAPVAAFQGRRRTLPLAASRLCVLEGTLRGVAADLPVCRVMLEGAPGEVAELAGELAASVRLGVPRAGLAAQALSVARGQPAAPRHGGGAAIPAGLSLDDALALATARGADVILHWAALVPETALVPAATGEPVHQMRVGVRRLRSALSVFRRAVTEGAMAGGPMAGGPMAGEADAGAPRDAQWFAALATRLKAVAGRLGAARDWDVFLAELGADVGRTFAGDRRVRAMLAASARRRTEAYAALARDLASPEWRRLELDLALLPTCRPWRAGGMALAERRVEEYAPRALDRRLKHVLAVGETLDGLAPEALHEVRKQAKRLRYAAEFFAPLYPGKAARKYEDRLRALQSALGAVQDAAMAGTLMAQLGSGADRRFASGVVEGFAAGRGTGHAEAAARAWRRFVRAEPFWA